jgi:uncharacterized membrane protein YjgN (DUF898 family)
VKFSFKLKGSDWFGLYLAVIVFYIVPVVAMQLLGRAIKEDPGNISNMLAIFCLMVVMMLAILILATPILRKIIGGVCLNDQPFTYSGKTGEFVLLNIGRGLLSLITLGIYAPWYATRLLKYLAGRTSFHNASLSFNGKGFHLFGLLLATLVFPLIPYSVAVAAIGKGLIGNIWFAVVNQAVVVLILIPYMYFVYKWSVNAGYRGYSIRWETQALPSMGMILLQILLTIITLGIYYPVALAKIYAYFMSRTVAREQGSGGYSFNASFNYFGVWKTVWAQILLTVITCGIYGAWAYCRVIRVFVDNTSVKKLETI